MKVINQKNIELSENGSIVTIGTFDGLHSGHIEIFEQLKIKANLLNLKSVVVTFFPHPRTVVSQNYNIKLLTPLEEKKKLFAEFDIDYLYIINFDKKFAEKSYLDFFNEILIGQLNAKHLVIGYDHKFGKNRDGNIDKLNKFAKENNIGITTIGPKKYNDEVVSSTKIREALLNGDLEFANKLLNRYYFLDGVVVEGAKRGRTLGFPTANLLLREDNKLVPLNGVYFVRVSFEDQNEFDYGVANIGLRPTFNNVQEPITEVHIFDFNKDIYDKNIKVEFLNRLRDEKKFSDKEELEKNIKLDVKKAKELLIKLNK